MAGEIPITVVGNIGSDPELRFTPSGAAVANFSVASTPRSFDKAANEWKDGEVIWVRCNVWRQMAENVAESLEKGMRVVVHGRLKHRQWETNEGDKRYSLEVDVDEIGPALKYATAVVKKTAREKVTQPANDTPWAAGNNDPWATTPTPAPAPAAQADEPPF